MLQPLSFFPVVALCAAGLLIAVVPPLGAQQQGTRQITHTINGDPSFSPDGRRMVYLSVVAGHEQLVISTLEGREPVQLTHDEANHEDPSWSPDGQSIAFVYQTKQVERIAQIPVGGGEKKFLSPEAERAIHPHWSPDGQRIAYCTDDDLAPPRKNDSDIKVIDLGTGQVSVLVTGGVNTYPAWSPDGRSLAFRRMLGEKNSEVFVADADGTHARNVTNHSAFDGWPAWSPDSKWLAFGSNRDDQGGSGDYRIFVMRPDGTDVRLLAQTTGRATAPQWNRDGRTIYFSVSRRVDAGFDCEILAADFAPPADKPAS